MMIAGYALTIAILAGCSTPGAAPIITPTATATATPDLRESITIVSNVCQSDTNVLGTENRAVGRIRNDSTDRLDVSLEVDFLNINGVLVDQASGDIGGLAPGAEARFDLRSDQLPGASCEVRVVSVVAR